MLPDNNASTPELHRAVLRKRGRAPLGAALVGLALASGSPAQFAAEAHSAIMVSVHVLPVARLQVAGGVPQLQITAADVAQGFVDAPLPLLLRIDSNSRAGVAVDMSVLSPWCTAVALQGFDSEVMLDGAEGTVVQRWPDRPSRALALRARFRLAATVRPGVYAWPLRLSARPL